MRSRRRNSRARHRWRHEEVQHHRGNRATTPGASQGPSLPFACDLGFSGDVLCRRGIDPATTRRDGWCRHRLASSVLGASNGPRDRRRRFRPIGQIRCRYGLRSTTSCAHARRLPWARGCWRRDARNSLSILRSLNQARALSAFAWRAGTGAGLADPETAWGTQWQRSRELGARPVHRRNPRRHRHSRARSEGHHRATLHHQAASSAPRRRSGSSSRT
jgi:hypothetical protein